MFVVGVESGLTKVAIKGDVEELVSGLIKKHLPEGHEAAPDDDLETVLAEDGQMEAIISTLEDALDVELSSDTIFALFAEGTVKDLVDALSSEVMKKTADYNRKYYIKNRQQIRQRNMQYRARNIQQIRRKSRIYRKKVKRRAIRPRKRIGSKGGGYTFIAR